MANSFHSKPISTLHLAWAAGFIEGEGSFSSVRKGSACVTAAQVQKEPIERLHALFGGRVTQRVTKGHSTKPIWVWALPARRSIEVMMTLYVLMSPRRQEQILIALNMWKAQKRILRSHNSTHCGNGHELTVDNTYLTNSGHKKCRQCRLASKRALRKRLALGIIPVRRTGRYQKGELNRTAKLRDSEVLEIKSLLKLGTPQVRIAAQYGVTPTLISMIKLGKHRA